MAAALMRDRAGRSGSPVIADSAGLVGQGRPVPDVVRAVMAERGVDVSSHRSRLLRAELVAASDLVVGMAREHVRAAVAMHPAAFPRSFTLRELVRRSDSLGRRQAGVPWDDWVVAAHDGRTGAAYLRDEPADDIDDPLGAPAKVFTALADELADLTARLLAVLAPV